MSIQLHKKDVFVSYSLADKDWVDGVLIVRLNREKISYFDQHRFEPGAVKLKAIEDAIEQSRNVLLVITSNYLEDSWDDFTNTIAFNYKLKTSATRVIPALKEELHDLPQRIDALVPITLYSADEVEWGRLTGVLTRDRDDCEPQDSRARAVPATPTPPPAHDTRDALQLLFSLIEKPEVHLPLTRFESEFKLMRDQIESLNGHKKLHDLFQRLEDQLEACGVYSGGQRPDAEVEWESVEDFCDRIKDLAEDLADGAARTSFATAEDIWMRRLSKGTADYSASVAARDAARLRAARRLLYEVLNTVPTQVNKKLVDIVKSLRLTALEKALLAVHGNLKALDIGGVTAQQLEKIRRSAEQVDDLDRTLRTTLFVHDSLQQIEVELRGAEPFLGQESERVIEAWEFVSPKLKTICAAPAFGWEADLLSVAAELEGSFPVEKQASLWRAFRVVRRKVTRIFNRVDTDMLARCDQLEEEIGRPLTPLLAVLQGFSAK